MLRLLVALVLTIALGVLSRLHPIGWPLYDKSLGDALYAVAAYLGLAVLLFRWSPSIVALLALCWSVAVECFKLTGVPGRNAHLGIVRWVLGTTFAWHNLACYAIGVVGIVVMDVVPLRPGGAGKGAILTILNRNSPSLVGAGATAEDPSTRSCRTSRPAQ